MVESGRPGLPDSAALSQRTGTVAKTADTMTLGGITYTRCHYHMLYDNIAGAGLSPFTAGTYYMVSCFVVSAFDVERMVLDAGGSCRR